MLFVAHKGESHDAVENTLASFNLAWQRKAKAIEGDFRLAKDGRIMCFHDESTKRICGTDLKISETDSDDIRKLDTGNGKIPFLEEVLATIPENGLIFAELKTSSEIVLPFKKVLDSMNLPSEQVCFISFNPETLAAAAKIMPEIKRFMLFSEIPEDFINMIRRIPGQGADIAADGITAEIIAELHANGMDAHAWTVDDIPTAKKLIGMGIDSITSNIPSFLKTKIGV